MPASGTSFKSYGPTKLKPLKQIFFNFYANLNISQLHGTLRDDIYAPQAHLLTAIQPFPSGKSAGPDGYHCKLYKAFHEIIVPHVKDGE